MNKEDYGLTGTLSLPEVSNRRGLRRFKYNNAMKLGKKNI